MPQTVSKIRVNGLNLHYGSFHALGDISLEIPACSITSIIGPSGCGKSTLLRVFNRMNDLNPNCKITGEVLLDNLSVYHKSTDVVLVRKKVGMVFQRPNVFPMSVYDNVAIGPRRQGVKRKSVLNEIIEQSLSQVALWDELKDNLKQSAMVLSAGQQQRLCIARCIAVEPDVILMDESCSALDPESTLKIEELMTQMSEYYTIVIVTHNMEQAKRVSDMVAFLMIDDKRIGRVVEYDTADEIFYNPKDERTEAYITGRFG